MSTVRNVPSPTQLKPPRQGLAVIEGSPEISWTYLERLEPGEYPAYCRAAKVYRDNQFKRWVCAVQFDVYDESLMKVLAHLTWYLNLGSKEKAHAGRRTNFWAAWVKANGGQPKRRDRISARIFEGRYAVVKVEDTTKNHRQVGVSGDESYSVIRDVIEWQTGGPSR